MANKRKAQARSGSAPPAMGAMSLANLAGLAAVHMLMNTASILGPEEDNPRHPPMDMLSPVRPDGPLTLWSDGVVNKPRPPDNLAVVLAAMMSPVADNLIGLLMTVVLAAMMLLLGPEGDNLMRLLMALVLGQAEDSLTRPLMDTWSLLNRTEDQPTLLLA